MRPFASASQMSTPTARKVWAFAAFNVYSLLLISAFEDNTAYLFDSSLIKEARLMGMNVTLNDWSWGDHYLWRLFSAVVTTVFAGILTGAIAKTNGKKTAMLANLPSVLVWLGMIYLLGFIEEEVEGKIGLLIISIMAIPLTSYVAYVFGGVGEKLQHESYREDSVLGVRGYHWIWMTLAIRLYALGTMFVVAKFLGYQLATWTDMSIFAAITSLFMLVPVVAWVYPLLLVHRVLTGDLLSSHYTALRGLANFGILTCGMLIASGIQFVIYSGLAKMLR